MKKLKELSEIDKNRVIEMAWEDRTPFDAILVQFDLTEKETITLMRREMKPSSFKMWRKRVQGRSTKHKAKAANDLSRFRCSLQKTISSNKISKR
ncbi:TIGR03643 family protein [Bernardetia litoralis DSM 6794]|uniref:TIGR03643 family protein n=1 Tax=Bernardetia litoralis (strain ATCC 23117 / DSM 6794 / NBRC 15988 / NCIMB 1366 / Fx l1 / Sio-4) TaxID=880071 RepID=I4AL57_BERLS|nr:TIGR03643 family protein [Bernardetia litoralis]AFM04692.1 TIGR03643 family protein [Bernardetia litoralis DSM 6794]